MDENCSWKVGLWTVDEGIRDIIDRSGTGMTKSRRYALRDDVGMIIRYIEHVQSGPIAQIGNIAQMGNAIPN